MRSIEGDKIGMDVAGAVVNAATKLNYIDPLIEIATSQPKQQPQTRGVRIARLRQVDEEIEDLELCRMAEERGIGGKNSTILTLAEQGDWA